MKKPSENKLHNNENGKVKKGEINHVSNENEKVAVSSKRQIAIPKEFFDAIGIEKEIIMELNDGVIHIKPVRTHTDDFSEEILADVIQEGFTGNDILKEFQRRKNMIRRLFHR